MARYKIITLVDITRSDPDRTCKESKKIGQQSNFNSLVQAIGIRSNIEWDRDPEMLSGRLPNNLEGKATHWVWNIEVEREDVFLKGDDPVGLLVDDLNGVPIIPNLDNSVDLDPPIFSTKSNKINTWIYLI
jgi:hypothetical protein